MSSLPLVRLCWSLRTAGRLYRARTVEGAVGSHALALPVGGVLHAVSVSDSCIEVAPSRLGGQLQRVQQEHGLLPACMPPCLSNCVQMRLRQRVQCETTPWALCRAGTPPEIQSLQLPCPARQGGHAVQHWSRLESQSMCLDSGWYDIVFLTILQRVSIFIWWRASAQRRMP